MSRQPDSLTAGILRNIDAKLSGLRDDVSDLRREVARLEEIVTAATRRMDHARSDMELIWRRLSLDNVREGDTPASGGAADA